MRSMFVVCVILLSSLLTFGGVVGAAPPQKVDVIIGFDRIPGPSEESLVRGVGGKVKYAYDIVPAIAASIPEAAIQGLLRNPRVTAIGPDVAIQATDDTIPWGVARIGADVVHQSGTNGSGVKVAILDTGIDYTHPDLASIYAGGYDFVNGDTSPMDDNGHGTHVAGTIAAVYNGTGVAGVAPGVEVYALKVLDRRGSGSFSNIIAALEWATGGSSLPGSIKVDVTNNSYASPVNPGFIVEMAFYLAYYSDGVLSVAAAGNSGTTSGTGDTVEYPAKYDTVIAVAATDQSDTRASFSSTGPAVELSAPGVNILSTYLRNSYATGSGTSMASPHVVGTAALIMSSPETTPRDPDSDGIFETNGNGVWTNEEVRSLLQATADDLGATGKDSLYGYGIVDADEAALVPAASNTAPVADAGGSYTGTEDITLFFDGSRSDDADGDTLTYAWDFGDGSTGTGVSPAHVYTAGGTYSVTLVVNDGKIDSAPSITSATIAEVNDPPVADAGPDQTSTVNQVVTFDGSGSYDIDGTISDYSWDLGDGNTASGARTDHTYGEAGTYTVVLTVTDNGGLTATDQAVVIVSEVPSNVLHVAGVEMSLKKAGINTAGTATVTVVDAAGQLVSGATVYGHWSGATTDMDSGTTNSMGQVTLQSDYVKKAKSGTTFTFTIDRVELAGWSYDPGASETSDSITVP